MKNAEARSAERASCVRLPVPGRSIVAGALILGLALVTAVAAAPASAAYLHSTKSAAFGPDGTEASEFPTFKGARLALDDENLHLYALESDGQSGGDEGLDLHGFDLANPYQPLGGLFPEPVLFGSDRGSLEGNVPMGLAVDNTGLSSNGHVYVVASYNQKPGTLYGFNSEGEGLNGEFPEQIEAPKRGCGVAVDSHGHIWVADRFGHTLDEYTADGVPLNRSIALTGLDSTCTFVFNLANDDVYVFGRNGLNSNTGNVWRYSAASNYKSITEIDPGNIGLTVDLAFDTAHQVLYVAKSFGSHTGVDAYNPDGVKLDEFAKTYEARGVAVDEQTGTLYLTTRIPHFISVFPASGVIPDANTGAVVGSTVEGDVDPVGGGEITACEFEYGTTTAYGSSQSCDQATPYVNAESVAATLPGLTPEVLYHYRVKVANATGSYIAAARSFVPHYVEDLKTQFATGVTKTTAELAGSYTGTGDDTHYYFEWGETAAYGNTTAAAPGEDDGTHSEPRTLSAPITGLAAGTTYHYRVIASNSQGTSVAEDRTFTASPAVADLVASTSDLTGSTATLNGDWTGDGSDTHYYFQWGATTAYGHNTAAPPGVDIGSGSGPQHVEVNLTDLLPKTRYHYRLIASNSSGTTTTHDVTFKTPQLAAVGYQPFKNLTTNSVELVGTVNPRLTGPTTFHFEYGPDSGYGMSTPESAVIGQDEEDHTASQEVTGLAPGTLYHYRLVATSPTGVARGEDKKVTTVPNLPTVVSTSVSNLGIGSATLNANVRPGHGPTVVYFQYGPQLPYDSSTVPGGTLAADEELHAVAMEVIALVPNTTYHYRAVAANFGGAVYGPDETFETPGLPEAGPGTVVDVTQTAATLLGGVNPRRLLATYHFELGPTPAYGTRTVESGPIGADAFFHQAAAAVGGLAPGTTYHFRLVATNALGTATGADRTFTTAAAPAPAPPPTKCRKGQVRRAGRCGCKKGHVKKRGRCVRKKRRHRHKIRHHRHHRGPGSLR